MSFDTSRRDISFSPASSAVPYVKAYTSKARDYYGLEAKSRHDGLRHLPSSRDIYARTLCATRDIRRSDDASSAGGYAIHFKKLIFLRRGNADWLRQMLAMRIIQQSRLLRHARHYQHAPHYDALFLSASISATATPFALSATHAASFFASDAFPSLFDRMIDRHANANYIQVLEAARLPLTEIVGYA